MYNKLITDLKRHAEVEYPVECCGIITNTFEYIRGTNIGTDPMNMFVMDPRLLIEYDGNIWGLYHSHPGDAEPEPSKGDVHGFLFKDYKFIVGNAKGLFIYWYDENLKNTIYEPFEEKHCQL